MTDTSVEAGTDELSATGAEPLIRSTACSAIMCFCCACRSVCHISSLIYGQDSKHRQRFSRICRQILTSPRKRRALCKTMRDSFQWVDETMNLFNDFGDSFCFTTESGFPSNGGLILFENTCDGHKGLCYQVCT